MNRRSTSKSKRKSKRRSSSKIKYVGYSDDTIFNIINMTMSTAKAQIESNTFIINQAKIELKQVKKLKKGINEWGSEEGVEYINTLEKIKNLEDTIMKGTIENTIDNRILEYMTYFEEELRKSDNDYTVR